MSEPQWKKAERRLAQLFGTRRRPLSGSNQGGGSDDAMHPDLYLESKYTRQSALWTLYRDTAHKAQQAGKIPVIGIQEKGSHGTLLVIHSSDLLAVARHLSAD